MIQVLWVLLIAVMTPKTEGMKRKQRARARKVRESEAKRRNRIQLNEDKDRLMIEDLMEQTTPFSALVDESHRVCARFMLAQQRQNIPRQRIPAELTKIIHQYSDYNEIRTLFQILTSPEDREKVFGFTSYVQMHRYFPSRADKVAHLKTGLGIHTAGYERHAANNVIFGDDDVFIQKLWFVSDVCELFDYAPNVFNWDAICKLTQLEELKIIDVDMSISMDDIDKLPKSLKNLNIMGNLWTAQSGDVDLSMLPPGLEQFAAFDCQGMNGNLKFDAPDSNLVKLDLRRTNLQPRLNSDANIPRSLKILGAPRGFEHSAILKTMQEKDIKVV